METISIQDVEKANDNHGKHWFDTGAKRFFRSHYAQTATKVGDKAYFVSSEQYSARSQRYYSVRVCDLTTGDITTVGEFQQYHTSAQAQAAIRRLAS